MPSLKKHSLFGAVLAAIGLGSTSHGGGNQRSRYIQNSDGAHAKCGSTKYINHAKVLQARKECAAHNLLLPSLRERGIVTRKGNVVEGRLADYNAAIAFEAKRISF